MALMPHSLITHTTSKTTQISLMMCHHFGDFRIGKQEVETTLVGVISIFLIAQKARLLVDYIITPNSMVSCCYLPHCVDVSVIMFQMIHKHTRSGLNLANYTSLEVICSGFFFLY